jgi:hypothetical protein
MSSFSIAARGRPGEAGDEVQIALRSVGGDFLRGEHIGNNRTADGERCDFLATVLNGHAQFECSRLTCRLEPLSISSCGKYNTVPFIIARLERVQCPGSDATRTDGDSVAFPIGKHTQAILSNAWSARQQRSLRCRNVSPSWSRA